MTSGTTNTGIVIAGTEAGTGTTGTGALTEENIRRIVRDEVKKAFAKDPAARKAAIIASKGTLD